MSCAMLSYNNIDANTWAAIKQAVQKFQVTINSDTGTATSNGFTVHWSFDGAKKLLSLQCTDGPWWAPCSAINTKINDEIEACLAQNNTSVGHLISPPSNA